jgi:hypothetical protein
MSPADLTLEIALSSAYRVEPELGRAAHVETDAYFGPITVTAR